MNTLTDIIYHHDHRVKPDYAVADIAVFDERLRTLAVCQHPGTSPRRYALGLSREHTRSGQPDVLKFDVPEPFATGICAFGLAKGDRDTACELSMRFNVISSEHESPAYGRLSGEKLSEDILDSCGFSSRAEFDNSPFKIVGLEAMLEPPLGEQRVLVDYQVVDKAADTYSFTFEDKDQITSVLGVPAMSMMDMGLVCEQIARLHPEVNAVAIEKGNALWGGSNLLKDNRAMPTQTKKFVDSGRHRE